MLNPHRQLICGCMAVTCPRVDRIAGLVAAWARRLLTESRAGALREAKRYMKHDRPCVNDATLALIRQQELVCECGRDALAAEAEPGAQG